MKRVKSLIAYCGIVCIPLLLLQSCTGGKRLILLDQGVSMKIPIGWQMGNYNPSGGFPYYHENPDGKYGFETPGDRYPCIWVITSGSEVDFTDWPLENFAKDILEGNMIYQHRVKVAGYDALEMYEEGKDRGNVVSQLHFFFKRGRVITWVAFASYKENYYEDEPAYRKCIKSLKLEQP